MSGKVFRGSAIAVLLVVCLAAAITVLAGCACTKSHAKMSHPQTVCPVGGEPINTMYYSDYQGKRVFFCSSDCKAKFEKAPADYMKAIGDEGVDLVDVQPQVMCPVAKTAIDKNIYTDYKGQRIYFASEEGKKTFLMNPDKYMKEMAVTGVAPAKSPA